MSDFVTKDFVITKPDGVWTYYTGEQTGRLYRAGMRFSELAHVLNRSLADVKRDYEAIGHREHAAQVAATPPPPPAEPAKKK